MIEADMVRVASAASGFEAKLIAARLGADGIVWSLRGEVDGMYPVGSVEILVPAVQADLATQLLAADDIADPDWVDDLSGEQGFPGDDVDGPIPQHAFAFARRRWIIAGFLVLTVLFLAVRMLSMA